MILHIPAGNPGPYTGPAGNNTWLVPGEQPLLVDAGIGAPRHLDALKQALGGRGLAHLFLTHSHHDHAGGAARIRAEWPGVRVWHDVPDGTRIETPDASFTVVATPGHAADHACLWHDPSRAIFTGDLLLLGGTVMIAASSGGNLRQYLESLKRVAAMDPARAYPGHGAVIDEPRALIGEYLAHRRQREQQVIEALANGAVTVDDLIDRIYPELDPELRGAARETMLAHLEKLDEEGRR